MRPTPTSSSCITTVLGKREWDTKVLYLRSEESCSTAGQTPCAAANLPSPPQAPCVKLRDHLEKHNIALAAGTLDLGILMSHDLDGTSIDPRKVVSLLATREIYYYAWVATKRVVDGITSQPDAGRRAKLVGSVAIEFIAELGAALIDLVSGPHITFLDPRDHDQVIDMVKMARRIHSRLRKRGICHDQIVISLPGTEQGACAAKILKQDHNIHTNITHITSFMHAIACLEARPTVISISVGRVLEWHEKRRGRKPHHDLRNHPGIETIRAIAKYIELHGLSTKILGTNFRRPEEIWHLECLDAIALTKMQMSWLEVERVSPPDDIARHPSIQDAKSRAFLRAQQAQYPTSYLSGQGGFTSYFSSESRRSMSEILWYDLQSSKAKMNELHAVLEEELERQLTLKFLITGSELCRRSDPDQVPPNIGRTSNTVRHHGTSVKRRPSKEREPPQSLIYGVDYF